MTTSNDMPEKPEDYIPQYGETVKISVPSTFIGMHLSQKDIGLFEEYDGQIVCRRLCWIERALTPPQSPNRAVLDALDKWDNQGEINHEELCLFIECAREHLKRQKGR